MAEHRPGTPEETSKSLVERLLRGRVQLPQETLRFVFVSSLDLFMTYIALRFSAQQRLNVVIVESNPVARYFLDHWGPSGLCYFKFAVVAFVATVAQVIAAKQRPRTAKWLLNGATLLVAFVVLYSLVLVVRNM